MKRGTRCLRSVWGLRGGGCVRLDRIMEEVVWEEMKEEEGEGERSLMGCQCI